MWVISNLTWASRSSQKERELPDLPDYLTKRLGCILEEENGISASSWCIITVLLKNCKGNRKKEWIRQERKTKPWITQTQGKSGKDHSQVNTGLSWKSTSNCCLKELPLNLVAELKRQQGSLTVCHSGKLTAEAEPAVWV